MKHYSKSSLAYKIRRWIILYLGIVQIPNYIALGIKTRGEGAFREIVLLTVVSCFALIGEVYGDFQRGIRGDGLLYEMVLFVTCIEYIGVYFSIFWLVIIGGVETIILLLGIVAVLQNQKDINDGKKRPKRKKRS